MRARFARGKYPDIHALLILAYVGPDAISADIAGAGENEGSARMVDEMDRFDLVVIGAVAAGTKAAAKARRERPDWKIAIVTEESDISYAGCGMPYLIGGIVRGEGLLLLRRPEDLERSLDIRVLTGHRVIKIDATGHSIEAVELMTGA